MTMHVEIGSRIRILQSRNPDRIGKLATITGHRRPGRHAITGQPNYVHPVSVDGVGEYVNGKPIAVEDGTFEVLSGETKEANDTMSAAFALRLARTGDAEGVVDANGMAHLDHEEGAG